LLRFQEWPFKLGLSIQPVSILVILMSWINWCQKMERCTSVMSVCVLKSNSITYRYGGSELTG
jgi:hypothetical protein